MNLKRFFLFTAGLLSVALGVVGIFLPLLPTTPFLLLSAACFLRSSERFYAWITEHKIFGSYISNYLKYHAVTRRSKIIALIFLWGVLLISIYLFPILWLRLVLVGVGLGVSIHLLLMRTLTDEIIRSISPPK